MLLAKNWSSNLSKVNVISTSYLIKHFLNCLSVKTWIIGVPKLSPTLSSNCPLPFLDILKSWKLRCFLSKTYFRADAWVKFWSNFDKFWSNITHLAKCQATLKRLLFLEIAVQIWINSEFVITYLVIFSGTTDWFTYCLKVKLFRFGALLASVAMRTSWWLKSSPCCAGFQIFFFHLALWPDGNYIFMTARFIIFRFKGFKGCRSYDLNDLSYRP